MSGEEEASDYGEDNVSVESGDEGSIIQAQDDPFGDGGGGEAVATQDPFAKRSEEEGGQHDLLAGVDVEDEDEEEAEAAMPTQSDVMPETGELAEVVLVGTSLGSNRSHFFSTKRLMNFLDCKAVIYIFIDTNSDTSHARDLDDVKLFLQWKEQGLLQTECYGDELIDTEVMIPQVFVDGISVGGETAVQDLEEDGDLDWIFARAACPSCLQEKPGSPAACAFCGAVFTTLISEESLAAGRVHQYLQGYKYNGEEEAAGRFAGEFKMAEFDFDDDDDKKEDEG